MAPIHMDKSIEMLKTTELFVAVAVLSTDVTAWYLPTVLYVPKKLSVLPDWCSYRR